MQSAQVMTPSHTRPRGGSRRRSNPTRRRGQALRPRVDQLEPRVLLSFALDPSFDSNGLVDSQLSNVGNAVAIQETTSAHKIVVAGEVFVDVNTDPTLPPRLVRDFAVVRLNMDGSIDTTFGGGDGVATAGFQSHTRANDLAIQSDGKIVVVGTLQDGFNGTDDFAVARFMANGSLDSSFGVDGRVTTHIGGGPVGEDQAMGISIQSDGKIVVVGGTDINSQAITRFITMTRYNSDGQVDTSFGTNGVVDTFFSPGFYEHDARDVAIQDDGKIIVVGSMTNDDGQQFFTTLRYRANGVLDSGFGADGLVLTDFSPGFQFETAEQVAIQGDGRIVVVGVASNGTRDYAAVRYNTNGAIDTSFDSDGKVTTDFSGFDEFAEGIAIQSDGKIIVVGRGQTSANADFQIVRYNSNGSLDSSFADQGAQITTDFGGIDRALAVTIQPIDNSIVVAGSARSGRLGVARYSNDDITDLGITQSASASRVDLGEYLSYTFTVLNNGPRTATGITVTDALPAGLIFDGTSSSQQCSVSASTVTCQIQDLAPGNSSGSVQISARVGFTASGALVNSLTVSSDQNDNTSANNTATVTTEVTPGAPGTYVFHEIAEAESFTSPSSTIDNEGVIFFRNSLEARPTAARILLTSDGEQSTTIADVAVGPFRGHAIESAIINDDGTVLLSASQGSPSPNGTWSIESTSGIFLVRNGNVTIIKRVTRPALPGTNFIARDINNRGDLLYSEETDDFVTSSSRLILSSNGDEQVVADEDGSFTRLFGGRLNDRGDVVFAADLTGPDANGSFDVEAIILYDGDSYTTVAEVGQAYEWISSPFAFDDASTVIYSAQPVGSGVALFAWETGTTTKIVDGDRTFEQISASSPQSSNNRGDVLFSAQLVDGPPGLFVGQDPVTDKVITTGDRLLGSTARAVNTTSRALNDAGQITFVAALADGRSVVVRADPETDGDGISNLVEEAAPNNGDGDNSGVSDSEEFNVASLPNFENGTYLTLRSPDGTRLVDVQAVDNPSPNDAPDQSDFPFGFLQFTIDGLTPGQATSVDLIVHETAAVNSFYLYGPEPDDPATAEDETLAHWFEFLFDAAACNANPNDCTGAEINGNIVTLHFVDGQSGDKDLTANGQITDPGGPALVVQPPEDPELAGNVTVRRVGRTLLVRGDRGDNNLLVESLGLGVVRITGLNGTRINTENNPVSFVSNRFNVHMHTGRGADSVEFNGRAGRINRLTIYTGKGDDLVEVRGKSIRHNVDLNTGSGNDQVRLIDLVLASRLNVITSTGTDSVVVDSSRLKRLSRFLTGAGRDQLHIDDSLFDSLLINLGSDNDRLHIERNGSEQGNKSYFRASAVVRAGAGDDEIAIGLSNRLGNSARFTHRNRVGLGPLFDLGLGSDDLDIGLAGTPNSNGNHFRHGPRIRGAEPTIS